LDMISIGTLLAFSVVCSGVLILRYQLPTSGNMTATPSERRAVPFVVLSYYGGCFFFAIHAAFTLDVPVWADTIIWLIFAFPAVFGFYRICKLPAYQENLKAAKFLCPLVPLLPCVGILMNLWFIMSLPSIEWSFLRILVWTGIGMAIYFGYGIRHSVLNKPRNYQRLGAEKTT